MLNAHPALALPHECKIVQRMIESCPAEEPVDTDLERLTMVPRFAEVFNLSGDQLRALPTENPAAWLQHLYLVATGYDPESPGNQVRWGDKNIGYTFIAQQLAAYFPDSQFVHLVRDVHDVAHSTSTRLGRYFRCADGPEFYIRNPYGAALLWQHEIQAANAFKQTIGSDRFFELKYEDLVADPACDSR